MIVTLREVALKAGVSRSAVSRTFTPGASVSAKTRAKVELAAEELGYRPSVLASALSTGRTKLIGLVSTNFRNPIFLEVFDHFTKALQARALRPLLVNLSGEMTLESAVGMLRQYSVDGVILASSTLPPSFPLAFKAAGLPVVHCFGRWSKDPEVNLVGIDNRACGRMAAETLLTRGYQRIGFLGGPATATSTEDRLAGFREALAGPGRAQLTTSFADSYSFDAGFQEMSRLIAEGDLAEAYFCGDDVLAIGAMSALRAAGMNVPEDIGILGLNDMEMAGWPGTQLTTIHQPIDAIVAAGVERIVSLLENPDQPPLAQLYDCQVVERGTLRARAPHDRVIGT
ncbi:LacI family DNA-binding transcriptional regulator [Thioclava sp. FR2]|uniref:LacI family DNA-binding transcriptional regulator n=1 Tax=Thioclava sp. FR2 TaxID=3445780 RepID=UPI003EBDB3F7